jgi:hypothetical protein
MKTMYLPALAVLVLIFAAGAAYAQPMPQYYYNYNTNISPPQYVPSGVGAGACGSCQAQTCPTLSTPACTGCGPIVTGYPASDCCNVAPARCGAFCTSGQTSPGWPYNFCSEYWLRPDSNY